MDAISNTGPGAMPETGRIRKLVTDLVRVLDDLGVAEKIYGVVALLVILTSFLVIMSIQSVRLQTAYRHSLASSATNAINIERVNGLIYAIVMESRGVYMSTERDKVKQFGDELLKRNRELADVVAGWEETVGLDDTERFSAFKQRITRFIEFRKELVRRAMQISPAAGREWGDNDANRTLRSHLNSDLEALARIYGERAQDVAELGDKGRYASWYLLALGLGALMLAALNVFVMKRYVIAPLSEITEATDAIAAGNLELNIPFMARKDEIGRLAHAMQNFRDAMGRNAELQRLELATAKQRDAVIGQRDMLDDKYHTKKWQLDAALNNMPQGVVMIDSKAKILMTNVRFRKMYELPPEIIGPDTTLKDILSYRAEKGLFKGDVDEFMKAILGRIASGKPSINEFTIADGRVFRVSEEPMAGGGWVSTHEDFTEQRRAERILGRTERFLATIIENVSEAIVAKDARDLRYTFVNRAAEKMLGLPRAQILGKSVRELFPSETAELIEERDREMLASDQENQLTVRTVDTPNNGRRTLSVRRLRIAGQTGESQIFLSLIEDRTVAAGVAVAAV